MFMIKEFLYEIDKMFLFYRIFFKIKIEFVSFV